MVRMRKQALKGPGGEGEEGELGSLVREQSLAFLGAIEGWLSHRRLEWNQPHPSRSERFFQS